MAVVHGCCHPKEDTKMVKKIDLHLTREEFVNLQKNKDLTNSLGNLMSGASTLTGGQQPASQQQSDQPFGGKSVGTLKDEMNMLVDVQKQVNAGNSTQGTTSDTQVQGNDELSKALSGQQSNLDLSKVPQDQKDFLIKNMMLLGQENS